MNKIDSFRGKYYFLSNFCPSKIEYKGLVFDNGEAAFQAMKCIDPNQYKNFVGLEPNVAKRKGRMVKLRHDWEEVKEQFMYEIVKAKFTQDEFLKQKLLDTGSAVLIEGNIWGDRIWGVCQGSGQNKLGKILMRVREELR